MADYTIFYSWQMDAPESINKGFIHQALNRAVKELGNEFDVEEADRITVDQGLKGVPGSPEVATMMFEKIGEAAIYVGDVSLVGAVAKKGKVLKKVPNPNVSIEEGFAAGVLGWERVICIANEFYGTSEEQAFDQRNRRFPINYKLGPNATKSRRQTVTDELVRDLKIAITTVKKYDLRKAVTTLEKLDIETIALIAFCRAAPFFPQPLQADPQAPIAALRDLSVWNRCLVRMQEHRLVRTDLGIDEHDQSRYAYHWLILGRKVGDLIVKKSTRVPPSSS
ncbi:MAG: hypothetical protein ABIY47_06440 [Opitutaceae bacterium]